MASWSKSRSSHRQKLPWIFVPQLTLTGGVLATNATVVDETMNVLICWHDRETMF